MYNRARSSKVHHDTEKETMAAIRSLACKMMFTFTGTFYRGEKLY